MKRFVRYCVMLGHLTIFKLRKRSEFYQELKKYDGDLEDIDYINARRWRQEGC